MNIRTIAGAAAVVGALGLATVGLGAGMANAEPLSQVPQVTYPQVTHSQVAPKQRVILTGVNDNSRAEYDRKDTNV
ncbi:hypothetical protein MB901379_01374 [Mycobacterium basiliense]|uniref:Uncharacterized protein n=1 Tax=Mycobacterium basiliense TaxID=2094119 RepID=A0A447GBJ3_9MYCO|nr:hypothetical protein [Mycobacterium basiliense]VDM87824.1 hypothetical protein MB901379_01374 [Mycobacterium basiliense]